MLKILPDSIVAGVLTGAIIEIFDKQLTKNFPSDFINYLGGMIIGFSAVKIINHYK